MCGVLQLLEGDTPGKVGGQPGDAFELVYTSVTDIVRGKMHTVDPVLAEYIRYRSDATLGLHPHADRMQSPRCAPGARKLLRSAVQGSASLAEA